MLFQKTNLRMSYLCLFNSRKSLILLMIFGLLMLNGGCKTKNARGPVPSGEEISLNTTDEHGQVELVALTGKVKDQAGNPIAGALVGANRSETGRFLLGTVTNESGQFRFRLPPGTYKIESSLAGFSVKTDKVTLEYGSDQNLEIKLAAVVPIGEPIAGPIPVVEASVSVLVLEISLADQAGLLKWLNEQMRDQKVAMSIIPLEIGKSVCCVKSGAPTPYRVIAVDGELTKEKIQECIHNNKDKIFVGIHRLNDKCLIIFREGK